MTTPPRRASRRLTSDHARELEVLRRLETAAVTRRLGLEQPAELES